MLDLFGAAAAEKVKQLEASLQEKEQALHLVKGQVAAIHRSQAVIEFDLTGKILEANENFLQVMGYTLNEIVGQHHRIFVDASYQQTQEYQFFWQKLSRGEYDSNQYKRIAKGGREVWIQASYNPVFDANGKPYKVVKFATDITKQVLEGAESSKLKSAMNESSVAIMMVDRDFLVTYFNESTRVLFKKHLDTFKKIWPTFNPDKMLGACIDMFHKNPSHQRKMLDDPSRLPYKTDISVGDLKISLNVTASYDTDGKYCGNVLEWGDVTQERNYKGQIEAINRVQAVIEFDLTGKIQYANDNFLHALGYSLGEIQGRHHSMFVEPALAQTSEYRQFWEKLGRGEFDAGRYKRIAKGGREIWIQASYNPIFDANGRAFKVVKYATDVTEQVKSAEQLQLAVQQIEQSVDAAIQNDLTHRIPLEGKNQQMTAVCSSVNNLLDSMHDIIASIKGATGPIKMAAKEIASGNMDLSSRTESQASSLEETSATMEQLTTTVKQNADNARQANTLSGGAKDVAVKGGDVVAQVVTTMHSIEESSRRIVDIISVIDGIAFQTNILALNAAVEAARAGEQGRGFAVVAAEVRSLAQRSASAAKEIKELISDSVEKVKIGSTLVGTAGKTMEEIVQAVIKVTDIVAEISSASSEQAQGIAQMNGVVTTLDTTTQQNAALVEEAAAAAKGLEDQANMMDDMVHRFRLIGEAQGGMPMRTSASALSASKSKAKPAARASKPLALPPAQSSDDEWETF